MSGPRAAVVCGLVLCLAAGFVLAGGAEIRKKAGDYSLAIKLEKEPPIVGKNDIEIEVRDASDAAVVGAKVTLQYYMPPMPRMAPMNYKTEMKTKKGRYAATMNLIMAGPWILVLRIVQGGETRTAKFSIDAR